MAEEITPSHIDYFSGLPLSTEEYMDFFERLASLVSEIITETEWQRVIAVAARGTIELAVISSPAALLKLSHDMGDSSEKMLLAGSFYGFCVAALMFFIHTQEPPLGVVEKNPLLKKVTEQFEKYIYEAPYYTPPANYRTDADEDK